MGRILDEGQPCEQAGFRGGFTAINHIHTVARLIEVSREYKIPLCLTFIDLKKSFDTVEIEAVIEALGNQGVPTRYIRMLQKGSTGRCQLAKLFSAAPKNIIRGLEWEDLGAKVGNRYLHHLRIADDIVLITPNIEQVEQVLAELDNACGKIDSRLNLTKTMLMKNGTVPDVPFMLNGKNISEWSSYVRVSRSRSQHDERPSSGEEQTETHDVGSI
uniref:Reverse transcriptase domain-containing protein n=1 Tax=Haemonchus contortus TaxID=6289 RepID=A0A7I4Z4N4_HAECO